MDRTEKEALVRRLRADLESANVIVITRQSGMTVAECEELRSRIRAVGGMWRVVKNRLARLALSEGGRKGLISLLSGPTAIAYSQDPVAVARVCAAFAKTNEKLQIVGGASGDVLLDESGVQSLALIPSLQELRGSLAGLLQAPAVRLAGTLLASARGLLGVLHAHATEHTTK